MAGLTGSAFADGRRLEILFLGDQGHHKPEERAHLITAALGQRGFNFTYTEELGMLNEKTLSQYDGLLVYANIGKITAESEQAVLNFVESGKGFIPVHCASFCFLNSPPLISLTGAQFLKHGGGEFSAEIVKPNHPAMTDVVPFTCWDETYVHHKHNPKDRIVLMERVDGQHREPWTWVRTHGKGRVFYTASGHDERAWKHPGFHQLLESGIRWAVGEAAVSKLDALAIQPLKYEDRDTVQNYEKRDPKLKYQFPLTPEEAQKHIQVPPGFEAVLFAAEPDIVCPMAMTWDERGRLWVLESVDYPNRVIDDRAGNDKIKILEDLDGDGRADKFTVFADGLNIPTGITRVRNGVVVIHSPDMIYYEDTNGDDRADKETVISTGWGRGDTHAGASNLHYGLDNYLWGCVGYSRFVGTVGGQKHQFGRGIYRFNIDGTYLEFVGQFSNNSWGLGFNEVGDVFGSTANNTHHMYVGVPIRYYQNLKGIDVRTGQMGLGGEKLDSHYKMHSTTDQIRQVDVFDGYTAAAGHNMYTARDYPKEYWNRVALVCEPTGGLVHKGFIDRKGGGYFEPFDGWNLISSSDAWFSPIHAEVGPDGQVWVADWYNFIIQHNPTPSLGRGGFAGRNGKGNAHENPLRDSRHGRIYRVVYTGSKTRSFPTLSQRDPEGLVAALGHDNMFWRKQAQRLLVERGNVDVVPALIQRISDGGTDALGLNPAAIHALWTLKGLGVLDGTGGPADQAAVAALKHPSAAVRKNAAKVLPNTVASVRALIDSGVLSDEDGNTRAGSLLALADQPADVSAGVYLHALKPTGDRWIDLGRDIASAKHAEGFLKAEVAQLPAGLKPVPDRSEEIDEQEGPNLLPNPSFETMDRNLPKGWKVRHYRGKATQRVVPGGKSGSHCVELTSDSGADTSMYAGVAVQPNSRYRLSAWLKSEGVKGAKGALLNVHEYQLRYPLMDALQGDNGWSHRSVEFDTGPGERQLSVNLLFGGWGTATGRAWYDDVELVRIGKSKAPVGKTIDGGRALQLAVNNIKTENQVSLRNSLDEPSRLKFDAKSTEWGLGGVHSKDVAEEVNMTISLGVIKDIMKFDKSSMTVPAGKKIKLVFFNSDHMMHNWLLLKPGSMDKIGALADQMMTDPEAMAKHYIPESSDILAHSKLLMPDAREEIVFVAPAKPGKYPYACTFPGHWRIMRGTLVVE